MTSGLTSSQFVAWTKLSGDAHRFIFGDSTGPVCMTKDEHRPHDPEQPFPDYPYLRVLLDCLLVSGKFLTPGEAGYALDWGIPLPHLECMSYQGLVLIEKSRQIIASWLCVAYLLWRAKFHPHQLLIVQSKKEEDAAKFVYLKEPQQARMSFMESRLPLWLQDGLFPASGPALGRGLKQPRQARADYGNLYFPNGSHVWAVPQGGDIVRSNTPSVLFCVDEHTKVLTKDLQWVEAGSVKFADALTAFEYREDNHWYWQTSYVLAVDRIVRPSYRLTFDNGVVIIASSEHKWLTGGNNGRHWRTTESLCARKTNGTMITRLLDTWEADRSFEGGYLAGFFDGEGYLSQKRLARGGWNTRLGVAQNEGHTLDAVEALLKSKGFRFTRSQAHGKCQQLWIARRTHVMEFLGIIRPPRLLHKFNPEAFGLVQACGTAKLVAKEYLGEREVVGFKTTTGTFIAEGLASHNSDECCFQPDFGLAYQAALPALAGGGQLIAVSSAEVSDFARLVEARI